MPDFLHNDLIMLDLGLHWCSWRCRAWHALKLQHRYYPHYDDVTVRKRSEASSRDTESNSNSVVLFGSYVSTW
jgi:hypothetical protein